MKVYESLLAGTVIVSLLVLVANVWSPDLFSFADQEDDILTGDDGEGTEVINDIVEQDDSIEDEVNELVNMLALETTTEKIIEKIENVTAPSNSISFTAEDFSKDKEDNVIVETITASQTALEDEQNKNELVKEEKNQVETVESKLINSQITYEIDFD